MKTQSNVRFTKRDAGGYIVWMIGGGTQRMMHAEDRNIGIVRRAGGSFPVGTGWVAFSNDGSECTGPTRAAAAATMCAYEMRMRSNADKAAEDRAPVVTTTSCNATESLRGAMLRCVLSAGHASAHVWAIVVATEEPIAVKTPTAATNPTDADVSAMRAAVTQALDKGPKGSSTLITILALTFALCAPLASGGCAGSQSTASAPYAAIGAVQTRAIGAAQRAITAARADADVAEARARHARKASHADESAACHAAPEDCGTDTCDCGNPVGDASCDLDCGPAIAPAGDCNRPAVPTEASQAEDDLEELQQADPAMERDDAERKVTADRVRAEINAFDAARTCIAVMEDPRTDGTVTVQEPESGLEWLVDASRLPANWRNRSGDCITLRKPTAKEIAAGKWLRRPIEGTHPQLPFDTSGDARATALATSNRQPLSLGAETIAAACPSSYAVYDEARAFRFVCHATHTEVLFLKTTVDAGLSGNVTGNPHAAWVR